MSTNDPNPSADIPAPTGFSEGQTLAGCYALSRRLSVGDGPEIWLAHDEVLGKDVTLHFLPPAVAKDSGALQELRQEIKRDRQLIHPQILRVYDLIEEPEWAAISMNAFEGESIAVELAKQTDKRLAAAAIEPWLFQFVQTIEDAHKINFLHRDLAPPNLFLTAAGQVLVANFGISRTIQDALARAGGADETHRAFASPQTKEGNAPARTDDVYSLGAVLYALLTGVPPDAGADVSALEKPDLQVPPAWRLAIAAALQKSPEDRPPTASEFLKRLKAEGGTPAPAAPAMEKSPTPVPVAGDVPLAKIEPTTRKEKAPAPTKTEVEKIAPVKEPPPEVEIIESKAFDSLKKAKKPEPKPEPKREPEPVFPPARTEPKKTLERSSVGDFKPRLYPEESRFPIVAVGVAAVLLLAAVIWHFSTSGKKSTDQGVVSTATPSISPGPTPEQRELRPLATTPAPPTIVTKATPAAQTPPPVAKSTPVPEEEKALAVKQASVEKAKQIAQAAEKTHADLLKQQQEADATVAESQKAVAEKARVYDPIKKAADAATAQRQKLQDDQKAAEAAAQEAQKVAAEKARLVEEGKTKLEDVEKQSAERQAAQEQANTELQAVKKILAEKQQVATDAAKAAADAEAARLQHQAAVAKGEKEVEDAKAAIDLQKSLQQKIDHLKNFAVANAMPAPATPAPLRPPPVTPRPLAALTTPVPPPATPVSNPATPVPPKISTPEPPQMARLVTPAPATPAPATPVLAIPATTPSAVPASTGSGTANSLGMKFAPVGDVEFCIWLTRVKDFEVFAKAVSLKSTSWQSPGFRQGADHPVVNVSWQEAVAFCKWLTDKEHKDAVLPPNEFYRLPTDLEWSKGVGLPEESGKTPEARDMGIPDVYPWGTAWPPPQGAGNYTGEETGSDVAIKGFEDGFAWTSPVGSFKPNKYGLYDMGGNVWQWCMDSWNNESKAKVLRGASWYNGALKLSLLSSCRVHAAPDSSTDNYGFRIIRASETPAGLKNRFR